MERGISRESSELLESVQKIKLFVEDAVPKCESFTEDSKGGDRSENRRYKLSEFVVDQILLGYTPPLFLRIIKDFCHYKRDQAETGQCPVRKKDQHVTMIHFKLITSNDTLGEIGMDQNDNEWNLVHRKIRGMNRKEGVASTMIKAVEDFVARYAEIHGTTQKVVMDAGQRDVLRLFTKLGYLPQTPEDEQNLQRILDLKDDVNDPELVESIAVGRTYGPDQSLSDWSQEKDKTPYVFRRGTQEMTQQNALRVTLEKAFIPRNIVEGVSQQVELVRTDLYYNGPSVHT